MNAKTQWPHASRAGRGRQRRLSLLTVPVVLALVLTGCGGGESQDSTSPDETEQTAPATGTGDGAPSPVAHYPLEDDYESTVAGAPALEPVGEVALVSDDDSSGSSAAEFESDSGLTLDAENLVSPETYTLAFRFSLEADRPGWIKLVDVKDRTTEPGFYVHDRSFQFYSYPTHAGSAPLDSVSPVTVALRRDADGQISWFVNGEHRADVDDSDNGYGVLDPGTIAFFLDDAESGDTAGSGQPEHSPGRVAWISVFDEALSDEAIADL